MNTHDSLLALADPDTHHGAVLRTRKMRWWYEALADYMITHPSATQGEMAAHFQRHQATISVVINTDAFKAYYRARRAEHAEKLDSAVREKLFRVADSSLDRMLDVLDKKRDSIPLETLHRTADTALKNLGYGASAPNVVNVSAPPTTVNVAVSLDDLERARAALRRNQQAPPPTIEHEAASEASSGSSGTTSPPKGGGASTPSAEPPEEDSGV